MILLIDLTHPRITVLFDEFVSPVLRIVHSNGHPVRVARIEEIKSIDSACTGVIVCGTALADTWYRTRHLTPLLNRWNGPMLGICAGMQMLVCETGGEIVPLSEIGMIPIHATEQGREDILIKGKDEFSGYALHQCTVSLSPQWVSLAVSEATVQIAKHLSNPWYGVLFHPEVRNEWIIERFTDYTCSHSREYERATGMGDKDMTSG